ncbi:colanic acid biosynthesis acetyltransferase WcaF [Bordetella genomosp. 10]|uniref:Colanic acid biosynthesis acetyltransferase WcaF n=1 Tax=Bordetella genomosp. 10 TaxID=1416804 RepID=A0A261S049_9BORD|nr:putative colanic acid biosynthesis acetyltransferase [Bordetella genomosp. 10]OZI30521.1 colanic acid biosynthesis acetyltransferase WcaF [Bordetella genomosp. 10]
MDTLPSTPPALETFQRLNLFRLPAGFRGRNAVYVQLWWMVHSTLFRYSPQFAYGFRRWLLRLFGAEVGRKVLVRASARITYPWKVRIGDYSWIGDDVVLYSLGRIDIGSHAVVSQRSYLCAGDHDAAMPDFPIRGLPVIVEDGAWIATDVFVGPGVTVRKDAVVGARSSVFKDVPAGMICHGTPCRPIRPRTSAVRS